MKYGCFCGGVLLVWCLACGSLWAQEASSSNSPIEFILNPVKEGFSCSPPQDRRSSEVSFKKESAYSGKSVYRHAIRFGDGPSDFVGVACDAKANTLYIDRNRNLDLTDDGPGVNAADTFGPGYCEFNGVTIEMMHGDIPVSYALDITIYGDYFSPSVRSGWKGDLEIAGKPCSMGVADNLDGVFDGGDTFVFDHERHRAARLPFGDEDELPLPRWFLFEGQNYHMESSFRVLDGETALAVTLTPITEGLMDISFEGQAVSRVLLAGKDDSYGMLDWPLPTMRIPEGVYIPYRVDVLDTFYGHPEDGAELKAGGNTVLKAGGPLNQEVRVARSGGSLNMDYVLKGMDDTQYDSDRGSDERAGFAVYKDGRVIETGQFEYG